MTDAALRVGLAQMAPEFLRRDATVARICRWVERAADEGCALVGFGEALLPGYPFWLAETDGARFDSDLQKALHQRYLEQAVQPESGHLDPVLEAARRCRIWVYLGMVERAADRGGHSLYCSLAAIDADGRLRSIHRKLMPTYEERLAWAPGDGAGLAVHALGPFRVGGLNCWENWMPLARSALYAQGEDVHVAVWPGNARNTRDITRFVAREARSYVLSVSGLMHRDQIPADLPGRDLMMDDASPWLADGGSCVAAPTGEWIVAPVTEEESLLTVSLDPGAIARERQNFDPSGHYARPDVTRLRVSRRRQTVADFDDDDSNPRAGDD